MCGEIWSAAGRRCAGARRRGRCGTARAARPRPPGGARPTAATLRPSVSRPARTKPTRSYAAASVGAGDRRARAAPTASSRVELGRVVQQLVGARGERRRERDDDLGQVRLQVAVARARRSPRPGLDGAAGERREDRQQVRDARLGRRVEPDLGLAVGDRRPDLLGVGRGSSSRSTQPRGQPTCSSSPSGPAGRRSWPWPCTMCGSGTAKVGAEPGVEPLRQVAGQLEVLALVLADRHLVGLVQQDVGGLQDRVGEQPDARRCPRRPRRLVLELRHPAGLAEAGEAAEHPGQLRRARARGSGRTASRARGRRPAASSCAHADPGPLAQRVRVVLDGDRVQVDDAVERVVASPAAPPTAAAHRGSCRGGTSRRSAGCRTGHGAAGWRGTAPRVSSHRPGTTVASPARRLADRSSRSGRARRGQPAIRATRRRPARCTVSRWSVATSTDRRRPAAAGRARP